MQSPIFSFVQTENNNDNNSKRTWVLILESNYAWTNKIKNIKKNPNKQINQRTKTPARRGKITTRINKCMCIELVCNKFMNKYIRSECVYGCVRIETMQIRMVHTIHITSHKQTHTICRGKSTFKWFLPSVLPFNKWHIYQIKILDSVQKTNN